ncbi:MAG: Fur family transcriptional regulator [Candidatus Methylacidiphilales bacterium]|nr:transcriptional repressor [Candidatus Methylacidiphilales bacterium]
MKSRPGENRKRCAPPLNATPDGEAVRRKIYAHLESRGLRLTTQRMAIIEAAFSTTDHYTAEDLLASAQRIDPSVSRATVYRTLPILVETGLLQELDLGREFKYYDPNYATHPTHNHLICINCKRILEFEDEALEQRENSIVQSMGFRPTSKHLRVEAACEALRVSGTCQFASKK